MTGTEEVTVLIPCLNEARTLGACVRLANQTLRDNGIFGEVVVADNGSTDGSAAIAAAEGARVVHVPAKGYGHALYHGLSQAGGRYVVFLDGDMSYDFTQIPRFVEALRRGADLVMGSRFRGKIARRAMPPLHRYLGTPVMTGLANLFFGASITDINCGMRGLRKEAFERLGLRAGGMEFASELLIKAVLLGMTVVEVPTDLYPDRRLGRPHLRSFRDGWRHLRFMLLFCPTWLFLVPGLAMTLGGLTVVAAVVAEALPRAGFLTSLLGLAATVLGAQIAFFGVAAHRVAQLRRWHGRDGMLESWLARFSLEKGLAAGALLAAAGGLLLAWTCVHVWRFMSLPDYRFGLLDVPATRLALLGATLLVTGIQTAFFSFFLSLQDIETIG